MAECYANVFPQDDSLQWISQVLCDHTCVWVRRVFPTISHYNDHYIKIETVRG